MPKPDGPQWQFMESVGDDGTHSLSMYADDRPLSNVSYVLDPDEVRVKYLTAYTKGRGHARSLMSEIYRRYPNKTIAWGRTSAPQSEHMAETFHQQHGRTTWIPTGDGEEWSMVTKGTRLGRE